MELGDRGESVQAGPICIAEGRQYQVLTPRICWDFLRPNAFNPPLKLQLGPGIAWWVGVEPGGGGTDSLSLGTHLETTAPFLGNGQPLVLPSPDLQPPLFKEAQGQPL